MRNIIWKVLKWGFGLYILTFLAEWLLDIPVFTSYKDFLLFIKKLLQDWWDWALITGATVYACRNIVEIKYDTQERIREIRFISEIERYQNTPYISPLFFYYLTNPPQSYSMNGFKEIDNRFYQKAINAFRDRVYINAHYTEEKPFERPSVFKLIGVTDLLLTLAIFSVTLGWFSAIVISGNLFTGWERFSIPVIIYFSLYVSMKMQAYVEMRYSIVDRVLYSYYGEPEPRIRWIKLLPNEDRGDIILKVWEAERERRQRHTFLVQNRPVPDVIEQFTNPAIAAFPYPSIHLPDWVEQAEIFFEEKQNQWATESAKAASRSSNVVPFNKKLRKHF